MLGDSSDFAGLVDASSGLLLVAKRAVAPELTEGGATTFATGVCFAAGTVAKGLRSTGGDDGGEDKRRCATGAGKGVSRLLSEVERVCKPSKCSTNTNTTKPQIEGRGQDDAG